MNIYDAVFINQARSCVVQTSSRAAWCVVVGAGALDGRRQGQAEKGRPRQGKRIGIYTYPHKIISQAPYKKGGGVCENPKPEKL